MTPLPFQPGALASNLNKSMPAILSVLAAVWVHMLKVYCGQYLLEMLSQVDVNKSVENRNRENVS
jgi:hypothetical protein